MSSIRTTFAGAAAAVGSSAALVLGGVTPLANADPPTPLPIDALQAPGMSAVQSIGPAIQRAAADPTNAASTLMAAAAVFAGDSAVPPSSKNVATSVNQFVAHVPAAGAVPGTEAHLPAGVDPAHAVGPVPEAAPLAAPAPEAVPAPAPPAPAPDAAAAPAFGPDAPVTQDFLYPSISNGCLQDGGNVLATAISVAGPAKIPAPGPAAGQTAYVFTAIGTPAPAAEQRLPLNVTWVNLTTGKSGSATLKPRPDINPDGPTTLSAIVDTGSGSIISTIFGQVTTTEKQCQFMPTIGSTVVP
ncbi:MAG: hypothetical protein QOF67_3752 [Mycobacterium sp.]|jgi:hypothetical protein|nr:hypothetical protein [Mycobacterium sp.]